MSAMRIVIAVVAATVLLALSGCAAMFTPTKLDLDAIVAASKSSSGTGSGMLGATGEANDAAILADLNNGRLALIAYQLSVPSLSEITPADLATAGWTPTSSAVFTLYVTSNEAFCIQADSTTGKVFKVSMTQIAIEGACVPGVDY